MKQFLACLFFVTAALSFNRAAAQSLTPADKAGIEKVYEGFMAAFDRHDAAAIAAAFTENGTHVSPEGDIVVGRPALKTYFEKLFVYLGSLPKADKTESSQGNWNMRYLASGQVLVTYTDDQVMHAGNQVISTHFATCVVLKNTAAGWLCDLVSLTPVKSNR